MLGHPHIGKVSSSAMSILHLRGRMTSDKHKLAQMAESLRVTHDPCQTAMFRFVGGVGKFHRRVDASQIALGRRRLSKLVD